MCSREIRASLLQKQFQSEIERVAANCSSPVGDAVREVWLVVQWLAEIEGALKDRRHIASVVVIGAIFDQPPTQVRHRSQYGRFARCDRAPPGSATGGG